MSDTQKPLPCPFCNGEALLGNGGPGCHLVYCSTCNATSDDGTAERSIAAWNRRATPPEDNRLKEEIARLEKLVYVPGLWRCAKCEFQLLQSNLNAHDGTVTARDTPGDKCPNCDSPLWRVTEREAGNDMVDRCEAAVVEARRLREAMEQIVQAFDSGNVEMSSPDIGGHDDIPLHPWHEEWLHHARAALSHGEDDGT